MDQLSIDIESVVIHGDLTNETAIEAVDRQVGNQLGPEVLSALGRALAESLRQAVPGQAPSPDLHHG